MFLEINGVDYSALTAKYGYIQTPVKRQGPNFGKDGLGNPIDDLLGTSYDVVWNIMPATASTVKVFADIAKQAVLNVRYFSAADNAVITVNMRPTLTAIPLALKSPTKEIYYGMTLTLEGLINGV